MGARSLKNPHHGHVPHQLLTAGEEIRASSALEEFSVTRRLAGLLSRRDVTVLGGTQLYVSRQLLGVLGGLPGKVTPKLV